MITQELIHPMDAEVESSLASPISIHSKNRANADRLARCFSQVEAVRTVEAAARLRDFSGRHCLPASHGSNHWGVVLAGGDGSWLRDVVKTEWGDDRPRQFCPLSGNRTLLDEIRQLAESSLPPEQILYSVTQGHERYYRASLADQFGQTIVQPSNKGTAPPILSALMHIVRRDPNAIVAVLPCDHSYAPESAFTSALESAFRVSEQRPSCVVLLGLEPMNPDAECGWIRAGETVSSHSGLTEVKGLAERPSLAMAENLFEASSLWNTFVMVGHVCTFLELAWAAAPGLMQTLSSRKEIAHQHAEIQIPNTVYDQIAPTDFTHQILDLTPNRLLSLRLNGCAWSDREGLYRVFASRFEATGELSPEVQLWPGPPNSGRGVGSFRSPVLQFPY